MNGDGGWRFMVRLQPTSTWFHHMGGTVSGEARGFGVGGGCSGGLGAEPPAGSRGRAPGQGIRGAKPEAPLKLKSFEPSEERGSWQICHPVKYCVNCSNILLEKVFVSPLP